MAGSFGHVTNDNGTPQEPEYGGADLRDLERRENRPCPGCGHLPHVHYAGRPASILYCDDCPGGICYTWTPDGREVGPGALSGIASEREDA